MRVLRQGFVWQFAGGFALGAAALLAMQPATGRHALLDRLTYHARS